MANAGEEMMMEIVMVAVGAIVEEVKMVNAGEEMMMEAVMVAVGVIAEEVISQNWKKMVPIAMNLEDTAI